MYLIWKWPLENTVGCISLGTPGLNVCYNESVCDRKQTWALNGTVKHDEIFLQIIKQECFLFSLFTITTFYNLCKRLGTVSHGGAWLK